MNVASLGAVFLLALVASAILLLLARDRVATAISRWRNPPEKLAAQHEEVLRRLQAPDWPFYAEHLQRDVPPALRSWFGDAGALAQSYQFGEHFVVFTPIDRKALAEAWARPGVLPFAESDGDPIYVEPGAESENAVFITYHDGGDTEKMAPSVEAFLGQLRVGA